jgi:hypothetical protein
MMAATLLTFWSVREILPVDHRDLDVLIFATALALMLGRSQQEAEPVDRLIALALVPPASAAAAAVGTLLEQHVGYGDAVFAAALGAAVWIRRFGPRLSRAGSALTVPFVAVLIQPVRPPTGWPFVAWSALAGAIACAWAVLLGTAATPPPPPGRTELTRRLRPYLPAQRGLLPASSRMAAQLVVALAAGFLIGRHWYPDHYIWPVLTAYIVSSGNRGRADVAYKGLLRIVGAMVGTLVATWLFDGAFGAGSRGAITVLFGTLATACFLRPWSYAYWAACLTAALAILTGYFGQPSSDLLHTRLFGIAYGGLAAVVAAWIVLPVRSTDVLRRRRDDALAALTDLLADPAAGVHLLRLDRALNDLAAIRPALNAARLVARRPSRRIVRTIDAVRALAGPAHAFAGAQRSGHATTPRTEIVAGNVRLLRDAIAARESPTLDDLPPADLPDAGPAADALTRLDAALRGVAQTYGATLGRGSAASSGPRTRTSGCRP